MNRIKPIGYSKRNLGVTISILIVVFSTILTISMIKSGASFWDIIYYVVFAAILAILFFNYDVINNRRNSNKIKRMEYLLSCPSVKGEIIELKQIPYFFGKEITNMPQTKLKVYIKEKNVVYRICAKFHNPLTDMDEIAVSEIYNVHVKNEIKNNTVDIHYSPDGDIWVEV